MFVHHVLFWLKENLTEEEVAKFETGVRSLMQIENRKFADVGRPAATDRPVIDKTYSFSLLTVFDDEKGHDEYQVHPVHKKFVEDCSALWQKVLIYDSETV